MYVKTMLLSISALSGIRGISSVENLRYISLEILAVKVDAVELAKKLNIMLWDRGYLDNMDS